MAEQARGEAEKLVVYLLDDFYLELAPVGRLDIVGELAKRAIDYYNGLPAALRTPQTERNRALALVRYGSRAAHAGAHGRRPQGDRRGGEGPLAACASRATAPSRRRSAWRSGSARRRGSRRVGNDEGERAALGARAVEALNQARGVRAECVGRAAPRATARC